MYSSIKPIRTNYSVVLTLVKHISAVPDHVCASASNPQKMVPLEVSESDSTQSFFFQFKEPQPNL